MRYLNYLVYAVAAIAIPLWIALGNFAKNPDSKITFAVDSATRVWVGATVAEMIKNRPTPGTLNPSRTESLLAALVRTEREDKAATREQNRILNGILRELKDRTEKPTPRGQPAPIEIRVDTIRVSVQTGVAPDNKQGGSNIQPPPSGKTFDSTNLLQNVYYLSENVPNFDVWNITVPASKAWKERRDADTIYLVLKDTSVNYEAVFDSVVALGSGPGIQSYVIGSDAVSKAVQTTRIPLQLTVPSRNTVIIRVRTDLMGGRFYIFGTLRSNWKLFRNRIPFHIPVFIPK